MTVAIFGATGMVGAGALLACLAEPRVTAVIVVTRVTTGRVHQKLREILVADMFALAPLRHEFAACDACLFCLGVTSAGMNEADYTRVTYDLTLSVAGVMAAANPGMTFCYVSGEGTDGSERGTVMWARVKGKTENALLALPFAAAYMFRPGFIQPLDGIRSKTRWYQALYSLLAPVYPLLHWLAPEFSTDTTHLGQALVRAALDGAPGRVLRSHDINALADWVPG